MPWQAAPGVIIICAAFTLIGVAVPAIEALAMGNGRPKRSYNQGEDLFIAKMDFRGHRINYFREQEEIRNGVFGDNFKK